MTISGSIANRILFKLFPESCCFFLFTYGILMLLHILDNIPIWLLIFIYIACLMMIIINDIKQIYSLRKRYGKLYPIKAHHHNLKIGDAEVNISNIKFVRFYHHYENPELTPFKNYQLRLSYHEIEFNKVDPQLLKYLNRNNLICCLERYSLIDFLVIPRLLNPNKSNLIKYLVKHGLDKSKTLKNFSSAHNVRWGR